MAWLGARTAEQVHRFLVNEPVMMTRGSLVIETRMPVIKRPQPLLQYRRGGPEALHLSLMAIPGGGITFVIERQGRLSHCVLNHSEAGRTDVLRLTYSWDRRAGRARLAVERPDQDRVLIAPVTGDAFPTAEDIQALTQRGADWLLAPDLLYVAASDRIEPVGPMPSLHPDTPIATPDGYRAIHDLTRGDVVLTDSGEVVPVLHRVERHVPALGSFAPVRVRAPFFGLQADIRVAPSQHLVLSGSDVEYLFGQEAVLVPVRHLVGGSTTRSDPAGPLVTYMQLLLPGHEALIAAGTAAESLYIGRLRRRKTELSASLLARLDRACLPEHGRSAYPVLRAYDALVLADQRAA